MAEGRIKWYKEQQGYGFIKTETGEEIFFPKKGIQDPGYFGLQKDDRVSFEIKKTDKGPQAFKVKSIS
jgi:CspA family cold shock protein